MGGQRRRRQRRGDATDSGEKVQVAPRPRFETDEPHLQPLIFVALAEEYGGLPSPAGTDWGRPAMPPRGVAQVMRARGPE
jgi:hypothetical protein